MTKYIFADVYVSIEFIFSVNHFIFCEVFLSSIGSYQMGFEGLRLKLGAS